MDPNELLRRIAQGQPLDELAMGATPIAPAGAEPAAYYSDVQNAGLGAAPMAPGGIVQGQMPMNPATKIAIVLHKAKQRQQQAR